MLGGVADTTAPKVVFNPTEGDQLYVVAPLAVRTEGLPRQLDALPLMETARDGDTTTWICCLVLSHPLTDWVTK